MRNVLAILSVFLSSIGHKLYCQEVLPVKKSHALTFTFVNPNSPATFEAALKKILLEKLLAEFAYPERFAATG